MARATIPTLLPLDSFAKIMGINPVHFQGAVAPPAWTTQGQCRMIWTQYSWQAEDVTSRDELAQAIYDAEREITRILGYPVAPTWITDEAHTIPTRNNPYFRPNSFKLKHGEVISGGRRASTLINNDATVVYTDEDSDGFKERATITVSLPSDHGITDPHQILAYFNDHGSNPSWEIRPAISRSISGNTATLVFNSWLFVIPDYNEIPAGEYEYTAIDISDTDNLVFSCTIYRVWNDTTQISTTAYRSSGLCGSCSGSGCNACATYTQGGCLSIYDAHNGLVNSHAAHFTPELGVWQHSSQYGQNPSSVHFWYYAGAISDQFKEGWTDDIIPIYLAQSVAYLAAARLDKPFCQCGNVEKTLKELRRDLAQSNDTDNPNRVPFDSVIHSNPFGTRVGEVRAWHRINSLVGNQVWEAAIL